MSLLDQIRAAGVAGCGGAGFPAYAKLSARDVDTFIVNAAECEPLLRTDRYLMLHGADAIAAAIAAVKARLGNPRAVIALKQSYAEEIIALQAAISKAGADIELHFMQSFYPAGDEHVTVFEVTGRVVPPAGLPLDVGCAVSNIGTMHAIYHAMQGRAFTHKYLTAAGAVREPCVIQAPLGTSFEDCLKLAGGTVLDDYAVVSGGPMMGKVCARDEAAKLYVTKTTSGFLILPAGAKLNLLADLPMRHMRNRAASACIQCSFCTQLCPRRLLGHPLEPHKIMRKIAAQALEDQLDDPVIHSAQYCSECGVCELLACPMRLSPRGVNRELKRMLSARGMRPIKGEAGLRPLPYRTERLIPTSRAAMGAGVRRWYQTEISRFVEAKPTRVSIALDSHIGAPAIPMVQAGDRVALGQCVAQTPQGRLGVPYHASIDGVIERVGEDRVVIAGEGE